jgi:hypothetical protein
MSFIAPRIAFVGTNSTNTAAPPVIDIYFRTLPEDGQAVYGFVNDALVGMVHLTPDIIAKGECDWSILLFGGTLLEGQNRVQVKHFTSDFSNTLTVYRDSIPPVINSPTAAAINATSLSGSITTTEDAGTVLWSVYQDGASTPKGEQIEAGAGALLHGGQPGGPKGVQSVALMSPVSGSTSYDIWYTHKDPAGNYAAPAKAVITTPAPAWTLIAHNVGHGDGATSTNATVNIGNTTGAKRITIQVIESDAGGSASSLTDVTFGNPGFMRRSFVHGAGYYISTYDYTPARTGADHTIRYNKGMNGFAAIAAQAWSSLGTPAYDKSSVGAANSSAAQIQPGTVRPAGNQGLFITTTLNADANVDSGFIVLDAEPGSGGHWMAIKVAYFQQNVAAPINPKWSRTGNAEMAAAMDVYKQS